MRDVLHLGQTPITNAELQQLLEDGACRLDYYEVQGIAKLTQFVGGQAVAEKTCQDVQLHEAQSFAVSYGFQEEPTRDGKRCWRRIDLRSMSC